MKFHLKKKTYTYPLLNVILLLTSSSRKNHKHEYEYQLIQFYVHATHTLLAVGIRTTNHIHFLTTIECDSFCFQFSFLYYA